MQTVQTISEVPQAQFRDTVVDISVLMQRQVPLVQKCQNTVKQFIDGTGNAHMVRERDWLQPSRIATDRVVTVPIDTQRRNPTTQVAQKLSKYRGCNSSTRWVEVPMVMQRQVPAIRSTQKIVVLRVQIHRQNSGRLCGHASAGLHN